MDGITAYPLAWPAGWPRTQVRQESNFGRMAQRETSSGYRYKSRERGAGMAESRDEVLRELNLLGAKKVVISTNVELRLDGLPYANRRNPDDPAVAVYFELKGQPRCIPCDKWTRVADNMHAIALTIAALRGLERWGAKHMVEAAFTGFKALPAGPQWWQILGLPSDQATQDQIMQMFKKRAKERHPDKGGTNELMAELCEARDTGLQLALANR